MDYDTYRLCQLYTLVLPPTIFFSISLIAYGKMKDKYMELKASYEPEFRETKEYKRYMRMKHLWYDLLEPLRLEADEEEDTE